MLIVDIETIAFPDADAYLEPVEAPSNYRDPAKIAAYQIERRAELLSRCALDPDLCRLACLGFEVDGIARAIAIRQPADEQHALTLFWNYASAHDMVGFNILGFDLPVLIRRSQYLAVRMPSVSLDRYRTNHFDLMERLSFNGRIKAHSLDFYCRRFAVEVPDVHTGADVAALVAAGDWTAVEDHCLADLKKTRLLAERIGVLMPAPQTEPAEVL